MQKVESSLVAGQRPVRARDDRVATRAIDAKGLVAADLTI